jgi:predicted ATP-grasp superfamily ATP-dependent carboligase
MSYEIGHKYPIPMKILLIGISTRALAQSASAAGYEIISLDFFGDSDQPVGAEVHSLVRDLGQPPKLSALAHTARNYIPVADMIVVEAGLENEPALLELCPPNKRWGNSAEVIARVRDLDQLRQVLRGTCMRMPAVIHPGEALPHCGHYLVKDANRSGGLGVREWDGKTKPQGREVLQHFVAGELASACFVADGRQARLLGLSKQYAGEIGLGAPTYAWSGNCAPWGSVELECLVLEAISSLTTSFSLTGLNGIDFIVQDGIPFLLEVNPRPPASFELFERLRGVNAFRLHVEACQGQLPATLPPIPDGLAWGKGIVYAPEDLQVGDTSSWSALDISDIPHPGDRIPAGAPVCTLFAIGKDADGCWETILTRARGWPPVVSVLS